MTFSGGTAERGRRDTSPALVVPEHALLAARDAADAAALGSSERRACRSPSSDICSHSRSATTATSTKSSSSLDAAAAARRRRARPARRARGTARRNGAPRRPDGRRDAARAARRCRGAGNPRRIIVVAGAQNGALAVVGQHEGRATSARTLRGCTRIAIGRRHVHEHMAEPVGARAW